ncbi:MAG: phosphatase PAP2 family protein [Planctomycetaceae bacterium]|jgi:membrane-associated phospholipid phosphatase|nr:phosphatase PAP2 family protein [Planctomycetaceae bacterium]
MKIIILLLSLVITASTAQAGDSLYERISAEYRGQSQGVLSLSSNQSLTPHMLAQQPTVLQQQPLQTPSVLSSPTTAEPYGVQLANGNKTTSGTSGEHFCNPLKREWSRICQDYRNLYSRDPMLNFAVALGVGGVFANTSIDQGFRDWYQDDVRSSGLDNLSPFFKTFGEGAIFIPVFVIGDIVYRYGQEFDIFANSTCVAGEFFSRTTRTYLVGAPTLLVGQFVLGGARPNDHSSDDSHWTPFNACHGISGHSFMGAAPFIVAAQMSNRWWLKVLFYALSAFPAWTRINDDAHYLSQGLLGWYLSYLSVRAVSKTDGVRLPKGMTIFPITSNNSVGLGVLWKR